MCQPRPADGPSEPSDLRGFVQSVGHDFNNIVTGILGAVSLAQQELDPHSPAHSRLEQIVLCSRRAAFLARHLLSLGESKRLPLLQDRLDINEVVLEARELLELSLPGEAVLSYELAPDLPSTSFDPWDLQGICLALTSNGGEALDGGRGVVTVRTGTTVRSADPDEKDERGDGRFVWVEVSDDGPGIPAGIRGRVTDAFFTTRPGKRGLGLFYVKTVVTSFAGDLRIESSPDGTSVRVLLPVA